MRSGLNNKYILLAPLMQNLPLLLPVVQQVVALSALEMTRMPFLSI